MEAIAISCKGSVSELSGAVRSVVAADIRFFRVEGAVMPEYLLYVNQQWVADHSEEWLGKRGPLAVGLQRPR
jgi:hypothetical protein